MEDTKNSHHDAYEVSTLPESEASGDVFGSNDRDKENMARMGKDQEMKRVFRQVSLISFTAIIMGTPDDRLGVVDGELSLTSFRYMAVDAHGKHSGFDQWRPGRSVLVLHLDILWLRTSSCQLGRHG